MCTADKALGQLAGIKQPTDNLQLQLKDLASNEMMKTMFPNLSTLSLSIPVATASVERSFSQTKLIKTRLRSRLCDTSLSHLMKIAIGSPDKLTDSDLEDIVDAVVCLHVHSRRRSSRAESRRSRAAGPGREAVGEGGGDSRRGAGGGGGGGGVGRGCWRPG